MNLPKEEIDVLVKLDNGNFAVAQYCDGHWYAGKGVFASYEAGIDILSGKVISWSILPDNLENQLETSNSKIRLK